MKIGIISINAHTLVLNLASPLHSYAFQQYLFQKGYDNVIIDYKPIYYKNFDVRHPLLYHAQHPGKDEKKWKRECKKWKELFYEREIRYDKVEAFLNKYYVRTDVCYDHRLLEEQDPGFDCYICATDVIWKYNPHNGFDPGYFLASSPMKGKGKIAYAASRGAKPYTPEQEEKLLPLLQGYDAISVREKSLKEYLDSVTDYEIEQVLDPVFLQDASFYHDLAIRPPVSGYVLIYMVMEKSPQLVREAVKFARKRHLQVIELGENPEDRHIPEGTEHPLVYDIGVEEWLGYMENAAYIFTNSFHGCVLSIIFHKQLFVGPRSGDKIDCLLDLFGLSWRRICMDESNHAARLEDIDYGEVDKIKDKWRKKSEDYLLRALKRVEKRLSSDTEQN